MSPDGSVALLTTNKTEEPILWDVRRATQLATLQPLDLGAGNTAFSHDGGALVMTTESASLVVDVARRVSLRTLKGHELGVSSAALSPDGRMLAAGGGDGTIALFQVDSLGGLPTTAGDAVFNADGTRLFTASMEDGIQEWDIAHRTRVGAAKALRTAGEEGFGGVAFSPNGRLLADYDGRQYVLWDVQRRIRLDDPLGEHSEAMANLVLSPIGEHAPDRVLSLVIGGQQPYQMDPDSAMGRLITESLAASRAGGTMKPFVDALATWAGAPLPADKRALWLDNDPAAIEAASAAMLAESDIAVNLGSWQFRCLLFVGAADVDFFDGAQRAAREIPNAEFVPLTGLDHIGAHLDQDPVLAAVLRTLDADAQRDADAQADVDV